MVKQSTFRDLIVLIILGLAVIFFRFNEVPRNLAFDEVELAKLALSLDGQPYIPYSELADGHGTPYFYLMLGSFKLFGVNSFAMRLPSALFGVVNILLFYTILQAAFRSRKEWWIRWMPLILSLTLLTQRWYFNFTRFAFETAFLLFLELIAVAVFFLWRKMKHRWVFLAVSALFAGLAYNSYQPGRIFSLLPLSFLVGAKKMKQAIFYAFMVAITALPMTLSILSQQTRDPRFDQQFFLKNSEMTAGEKAQFLGRNAVSSIRMFIDKGDVEGRHNYPGKPAVNPLVAVMMFGGIVLALRNHKDFFNRFFLVWCAIAFIPTNLTYPWENPNMLRTYTALPSIIYFVGQSVIWVIERLKKDHQKMILLAMISILIFSAAYDLRTYFIYQVQVMENAFERENDLKRNIESDYRNQRARPSL